MTRDNINVSSVSCSATCYGTVFPISILEFSFDGLKKFINAKGCERKTIIGDQNKHIYYWDQNGFSNDDYLTLRVDHVPLFCGRTALHCYEDFMSSFAKKFEFLIGTVIEEISVGLGPSGVLKYPAHPFGDGRCKFPGIGEFQCYDKYMMDDLKMAARKEGKPQWEEKGPQKTGCYNSLPSEVPFFGEGEGSFLSDYGCFFLV
ncbi:hypothetical protein ACFX1X_030637 [Malus domestica]